MNEIAHKTATWEPAVAPQSPMMALAEKAIAAGQVDQLERLLAMHEKWEADQARKAYNHAIAQFRANPPTITKNKEVAYGNTRYKHATLDHVAEAIGRVMAPLGMSFRWETKQESGQITVTCWVSHESGHREATTLSAPADTSGQKNAIQAIGSTVSYLQRYSLLAATGLAAEDQDDDGHAAAPAERITDDELRIIEDMIEATGTDLKKFLGWIWAGAPGQHTLAEIHRGQMYDRAMNALKAKQKQADA